MLVVLLLGAAAVLAGPVSPAAACDCAGAPTARHYADADVVFTGTLESRTVPEPLVSSADPATWVFAVDRALKGSVPERAVVLSPVSGASCGLELTGTGPFVVFAGDAGTHLTAGLCQGTAELTPALERELDGLDDGSGTVVASRDPVPDDPAMGTGVATRAWPAWAYLVGAVALLALAALGRRVLRR